MIAWPFRHDGTSKPFAEMADADRNAIIAAANVRPVSPLGHKLRREPRANIAAVAS